MSFANRLNVSKTLSKENLVFANKERFGDRRQRINFKVKKINYSSNNYQDVKLIWMSITNDKLPEFINIRFVTVNNM